MKCPCCRSELVEGEMLRLETLEEHVCDPNGEPSLKQSYYCSNPNCPTVPAKIYWNYMGERYNDSSEVQWIDYNDAPLGSFQRKCNVEIYKKDENHLLCTIPCWPLKGWRVKAIYSYTSNENGDILSRIRKLEWITNEGIIHIWGISMLWYSIREIWRDWKLVRKNPSNNIAKIHIESYLDRANYPRAQWWRKWSASLAKIALKTA